MPKRSLLIICLALVLSAALLSGGCATPSSTTSEEMSRADAANESRALARAQLRQQLPEFATRETARGFALTLDDSLFETDSSDLKPGAFRDLEKLSDFLKRNPGRNIVVEGRTESMGDAGSDFDLSHQRAAAVAQALRSQGVEPSRIVTRGYRVKSPVASTPPGKLQNQRVDIIIEDSTRAGAGGE